METCQKDTRASLKGFLLAVFGTIWASERIMTVTDYTGKNKIKIHKIWEQAKKKGKIKTHQTKIKSVQQQKKKLFCIEYQLINVERLELENH